MKPHQLQALIAKGESQNLDFKKTITHQWKIAKTIAAFANTNGGQLLVGVMDDLTIIGVDPEEEKFSLQEAAIHFCQPQIPLDFSIVEDADGLLVLIVNIKESKQKPHFAQSQKGDWNVYIRMKDKSILASRDTIKKMQKGVTSNSQKNHDFKKDKQTQKLLLHLSTHEKITVKEYAKLVNISPRRAKRILADLSIKGLLLSHDLEKETSFFLA